MTERKGIILSGGTGSRLWPITVGISKQLVPIYDKPMIYYPLSVLMLSGIREIAIITTQEDQPQFQKLMGDGSQWGVRFEFLIQESPDGLAQAYILAEDFLDGCGSAMVLGDNIFYGHGLSAKFLEASERSSGGTVFGYRVNNPSEYGVVSFDDMGRAISIVEKPKVPTSNYAVTGIYFLDERASEIAKSVTLSERGELEIVSVLQSYLVESNLYVDKLGRGYSWLDTGTNDSLLDASNYVRTLQLRQGLLVGSPDEIAYQNGWIDASQFELRAKLFAKSQYGTFLKSVLEK